MKHLRMLTALTLSLMMCLAATAEDVENAPTPTDLTELLPEDGLGEGVDFFLLMTSPLGDEQMSLRWSIKPDGETIVCMVETEARDEGFRFNNTSKLVYSKAGELLSYEEVNRSDGHQSTTSGRVADGKLVITSVNVFEEEGFEPEPEVKVIDLKDIEGMLPMESLPLIFAYHIREGNLGFSVMTFESLEHGISTTMTVEDNGTEVVEFNGAEHTAHSLAIAVKQSFKPDPDFPVEAPGEQKLRMRVLKDGTIFSMTMTDGELDMKAKRATAEEVAKAMKRDQPPAAAGDDEAPVPVE